MQSPTGQPSIEIFGITIMEPMSLVTNLFISSICLFAFLKLRSLNKKGASHKYLRSFFLLMAIATFLGGTLGHAFQYIFNPSWQLISWLPAMVAVFLMERVAIIQATPFMNNTTLRFLKIVGLIVLTASSLLSIYTVDFLFVMLQSVYSLLFIALPLHGVVYFRTQNIGSGIISLNIVFLILVAFIYVKELSLGLWFNHLDIAHTILVLSMYLFYIGARRFQVITEASLNISVKKPPLY